MSKEGTKVLDGAIYFYGKESPFSNFYMYDGDNAHRHFVMKKAGVANDMNMVKWLRSDDEAHVLPEVCDELSRRILGLNEETWDDLKDYYMMVVHQSKFTLTANVDQKGYSLAELLMATDGMNLIEATSDDYWGCGVEFEEICEDTIKDANGTNTSGKSLMVTRDKLRLEYEIEYAACVDNADAILKAYGIVK